MTSNKKIPVTIITGFLGAGKTTFLNHYVREVAPERILVIENEVGQTNIDGALVEKQVEDVVELTAGCLCCSLSDGLLDALEVVSAKQDSFDHLVIETTGVADPSSIVETFLVNNMVGKYFDLKQVICLADAGLLTSWLADTEEALRQLVIADVVLLNKIDTVEESGIQNVQSIIQNINPYATVLTGEQGVFSITDIRANQIKDIAVMEEKLLGLREQKEEQFLSNATKHNINTFTLTFDKPFKLSDYFSLQLHRLVNLYRDQVYRVKGIIHVVDYPNRVVIQSVRTACVVTDGSPWKENEKRVSEIVFIGRGLKKKAMEDMFKKYIVK